MPTLVLFDVDGTLTVPRNKASQHMLEFLEQLKTKVTIGIVGGSDLEKIKEQLCDDVTTRFPYVFSENGLVAHADGKLIGKTGFKEWIGEKKYQDIVNFCLHYIANLDIPVKTGTFIESRSGMLNVSPIGRNCSQEERDKFEKYDKLHNVRKKFVEAIMVNFKEYRITCAIGGQISFDLFPEGWNKTYCLKYLDAYDTIYFFGDKTLPGENDYEIFISDRTKGFKVNGPDDTIRICQELFFD